MWSIYDTCILLTGIFSALIAVIPRPGIPVKTRLTGGAVGLGLIILSFLLGSLSSFRYPSIVFLGPIAALCALLAIGLPDRSEKDAGSEKSGDGEAADTVQPPDTSTEIQPTSESFRSPDSTAVRGGTAASLEIYPPSASTLVPQLGTHGPEAGTFVPQVTTPPPTFDTSGHSADTSVPWSAPLAVDSSPATMGTEAERATAWAEAHDPSTSSGRLAELAARHPEFAPAIVSHPNCYQALSDWARTNGLLGRS